MRFTLGFCIYFFVSIAVFAQKKIPVFGKISNEEINMSYCAIDSSADAMILLEHASVSYSFSPMLLQEKKYHVRIKIFNDGAFHLANVQIPYFSYSNQERIIDIEAQTFNQKSNGNIQISKVDSRSFYIKKITGRLSLMVFTFPNVKAGSIIEYKYTIVSNNKLQIDTWYFQKDIPVAISNFELKHSRYLEFTYQLARSQSVEVREENMVDKYTIFTMRNIGAIKDEPFASARNDNLQRVNFQLSGLSTFSSGFKEQTNTWERLSYELLQDIAFGWHIKKRIPVPDQLDSIIQLAKTDDEKIKNIYDYIRFNFIWNGEESLYASENIRNVLEKKTGTSAEMNFILITLLRQAGLEAHPILISTNENGKVNKTFPFIEQFNGLMTYVKSNNRFYVLNASDIFTPVYLFPQSVNFTEGYLVKPDTVQWIQISDSIHRNEYNVAINTTIDSNALLTGNINWFSLDYNKIFRYKKWREDSALFIQQNFLPENFNASFSNVQIQSKVNDSIPWEQSMDFKFQLVKSDSLIILNPNLCYHFHSNPFTSFERQSNIDFECLQSFSTDALFIFPPNYELYKEPKSIQLLMPDSSIAFTKYVSVYNNQLLIRTSIVFHKKLFFVEEYEMLKNFYSNFIELINENIILKMK